MCERRGAAGTKLQTDIFGWWPLETMFGHVWDDPAEQEAVQICSFAYNLMGSLNGATGDKCCGWWKMNVA